MNGNYGSKIQGRDDGEVARKGLPETIFEHNSQGGGELRSPRKRTFLEEATAMALV